jgi:hypothetical protein
MLIVPRNIQAPCLWRRGMPTIFLRLGIFQPAKWGIFNRRKLGNIQPALTRSARLYPSFLRHMRPLLQMSRSTMLRAQVGTAAWSCHR